MPRKDKNLKKLATIIVGMFTLYGQEINELVLDLYCKVLSKYSYSEVENAITKTIQTKKFCPKPVEIIELIEGSDEDKAEIEAGKVIDAIGSVGPYTSVVFDDPVTQAVIDSYGGWPEVCDECINKESEKWFRINFKKTYRAFSAQGIKKIGYLPGLIELHNRVHGYEDFIEQPVMIGDAQKARLILEQGKEKQERGLESMEKIKEMALQ